MGLILASQSPRRRELLARLGLPFTVEAAGVDETMDPDRDPFDEVARLSQAKAAAAGAGPDDTVIAADTVVVLDGTVLGKPKGPDGAAHMLHALSGRDHQVMSGLTVRRGEQVWSLTAVTRVWFRALSGAEIAAYVASGEPHGQGGGLRHSGTCRQLCRAVGRGLLQCGGPPPLSAGWAAPPGGRRGPWVLTGAHLHQNCEVRVA